MTQSFNPEAAFDEAGDTGLQKHSSRYLVIAGVVCDDVLHLRRVISQVRKGLDKRVRDLPEIKAARLAQKSPHIIIQVLTRLTNLDVEVYAAVIDKKALNKQTTSEAMYTSLYVECFNQALRGRAELWALLDRYYTKTSLQDELIAAIVRAQGPKVDLIIEVADSHSETALQVADVVAWSIFQKYERGVTDYHKILQPKIVGEILITGNKKAGSP